MCRTLFDVAGKKAKIDGLTKVSTAPDFWNDNQAASAIMRELEGLKDDVERVEKLAGTLADLTELNALATTTEERADIEKQCVTAAEELEQLEFHALLSGDYDRSDAIVAIHAGAGGVDAQDWSEMLLRMYARWAERNEFGFRVIDESRGGEAGIKSVTFEITGQWAYGYLKAEAGVHRLVRLSPFNADNLRQTSFALVEALPIIGEIAEVEIADADLKIDTFRASGAGGQHVNKTDSAVRITHTPTGLVAACQSERSQAQNKEHAMKVLKAKLHQKFLDEQEAEKQKLRGEHHSAEWGSQIRSYVLHPYKLVKDHRTKHETAQTEDVLDGDLSSFMDAFLHWKAKK